MIKKRWLFTIALVISIALWMWCADPIGKGIKRQVDNQNNIDNFIEKNKIVGLK